MEENESQKKRKSGLHKEISSIFEGVPIPGRDNAQQPSGAAPKHPGQIPTKPTPSPAAVTQKPGKQPAAKATPGKSPLQEIWKKITNKLLQPEEGVSPTRQKVMLILIPVLAIALIIVFMPFFKTPSRDLIGPKKIDSTKTTPEPGRDIDWPIPKPYPAGLRDPTQLGGTSTSMGTEPIKSATTKEDIIRSSRLPVKGIVFSKDYPAAVIGTQLVHEGDMISDVTVLKINRDSVEFEMNNERWIQRIE